MELISPRDSVSSFCIAHDCAHDLTLKTYSGISRAPRHGTPAYRERQGMLYNPSSPDCDASFSQAMDQAMDLRNDVMGIVYPFSKVKSKDDFPDALKTHMESCGKTHLTKLEGFCVGPYMCGPEPQSSDFHIFEIIEHHMAMCEEKGIPFDMASYPKLKELHAKIKADPKLASYFRSDSYSYSFNNPMYTHFNGKQFCGTFGPTEEVSCAQCGPAHNHPGCPRWGDKCGVRRMRTSVGRI